MALIESLQKPALGRRMGTSRSLRWLSLGILLALTAVSGQSPTQQYRLFQAASPYQFDVVGWMAGSLLGQLLSPMASRASDPDVLARFLELSKKLTSARATLEGAAASSDTAALAMRQEQVASLEKELDSLAWEVQELLGSSVSQQLLQHGLGGNLLGIRPFPPVNFRMIQLPEVLIVSPRERIRYAGAVLLQPGLSVRQMEQVETRAEALGYSALVVPIGGLGTYPAMVPYSSNLKFLLTTVAHEWTHQYLALRPLGYRYSLGLERDPDVIAINETVADMVGQEIGEAAYAVLNSRKVTVPSSTEEPKITGAEAFDFNAEMRRIRLEVDRMLAAGRVQEAEQFMEQSRQRLVAHGYPIRKLNQAYFAFYGSYADAPYSVSPIGQELRELRSRYNSLAEFLQAVSSFRSHDDLRTALDARR
jgi:hypothetical protein